MHFAHNMEMHESVTISQKSPEFSYKYTPDESFICTQNERGKSICLHDSGNPLVHKNTLIGVASYNFYCSSAYPDMYTKVFEQLDWIQGEMKKMGN